MKPPLTQADIDAWQAEPPGPPTVLRACRRCSATQPPLVGHTERHDGEPRPCRDGSGYCRLLGREATPTEIGAALKRLRGILPKWCRWVSTTTAMVEGRVDA